VWQTVLRPAEGEGAIAFRVEANLARPRSGVWGANGPDVAPTTELREFLVTATSTPGTAVRSQFIALGPAGASAELQGEWESGPVALYRQSVVAGRDARVLESWCGTLLPFGHRAVVVKTAVRDIAGQRSPLVWHDWLVVRQPVQHFATRRMPFQTVQIIDETVQLAETDPSPCGFQTPELRLTGVDAAGRVTAFSMPLWFRADPSDMCGEPTGDPHPVRVAQASGSVCFSGETRDAATMPVRALAWTADAQGPSLEHADVDLPAVSPFTGSTPVATVAYHQHYLANGLGQGNPNQLVLSLSPTVPMKMGTAASGGVATPSLKMGGISALTGLLPGQPDDAVRQGIAVTGVLDSVTVLGLRLSDLAGGAGARVTPPQLFVDPSGPRWGWSVALQSHAGVVSYTGPGTLDLSAAIEPPSSPGGRPRTRTRGRVSGGTISFASVLDLPLEGISFSSLDGDPPHVDVGLGKVKFTGVLAAAAVIADHLPQGMGGSRIDVSPAGVTAALEVNLGSIPLGMLLLQDLNLASRFLLPLTDAPPELQFSLASRERPFHITVCGLGGGGHFALVVSTHGVEQLEACLEFGGALALDLGVASGSVSIMGGVAFAIDVSGATLMAYLRVNGSVEVLGLVRISVLFLLQLAYDFGRHLLWGQAMVRVQIEVAFFSDDVELTVHRELSVGSHSPSFTETFHLAHFTDYARAFFL
jgi:hypothetical protein